MTVLGIDTATAVTAVGVVREGRVLAESSTLSGGGHSATLPALVREALGAAGLRLPDLQGLAISIGPGSFTGLRVGLSFAKGMAFASSLPVVGVDTLAALACAAPGDVPTVATATDARRGEVYLALFRRTAAGVERIGETRALAPESAVKAIVAAAASARVAIVGDAPERYPRAFATLADEPVAILPFWEVHPRGSIVASLGEARLRAGASESPQALVPFYVRPPTAEQQRREATLTTENAVS